MNWIRDIFRTHIPEKLIATPTFTTTDPRCSHKKQKIRDEEGFHEFCLECNKEWTIYKYKNE